MNNNILIYFEVKSESIPKIIAHYLLNVSEWDFIKTKLKREFEFILDDSDLYGDKIIINQDNLSITEITNTKFIDAFRILHKNYFYTYDLLSFFRRELDKPVEKKENGIFEMDDEDSDIGFYLKTKKSTPEFSNLCDEKVKQFVMETKKTVKLFKNPNGNN